MESRPVCISDAARPVLSELPPVPRNRLWPASLVRSCTPLQLRWQTARKAGVLALPLPDASRFLPLQCIRTSFKPRKAPRLETDIAMYSGRPCKALQLTAGSSGMSCWAGRVCSLR